MARWASPVFCNQVEQVRGSSATGCFDQYVVSVTTAGAVTYDIDRHPFEVAKGSVVVVHPNTPQHWQLRHADRWQTTYCVFTPRPYWLPWLRLPQNPAGYTRFDAPDARTSRRIRQCFTELLRSKEQAELHRADFDLNLIERIVLLVRSLHTAQIDPMDERVRAALEHIAGHLAEPISLESLAEAAGSSRSRLAALFRDQVGQPPMAYVENQRMMRAMQLLRYTDEPIAAIAQQAGFPDPHYFSNRFRQHANCSPREYRNTTTLSALKNQKQRR